MYKFIKTLFLVLFSGLFCHLSTAETIKIGLAGPFSGPYVAAGDQQWIGAMLAVDDINEKGGINGNKLMLVNADDACNPKKAEKIARKFVNSKEVIAVIGHNCSSTTLAASKIYGEANMLMITPASTNPDITEHQYHSIFRTCGRDDSQAELAANFITNKLNAKNIIIVSDGSVYGNGLSNSTKKAFEKIGTNVTLFQGNSSENNYPELAEKISKLNPDVIYFGGLQTDAGNFLKLLRERGNKAIFVGGDGIASPDFVRAAGGPNIVQDVYMTFFRDPSSIPEAKKAIKKFEEKRAIPTGYTLNAYAAVQALAEAIKNTSPNYSKMSDWLHQNKVDSIIGTLEWNEKGDLKEAPFIIYKWNDEGNYEPY